MADIYSYVFDASSRRLAETTSSLINYPQEASFMIDLIGILIFVASLEHQ
jgi:hypothetical protein